MFKNMKQKSKQITLSLLNHIWKKHKIPSSWKHAIICPILKTGKNPTLPLSYRPIALTSHLCKIMERMVNNRLIWILETYKLININQSGFRKNRCTLDQLIRLENEIKKSKLNKETLITVFIDFEKAFDMLWKDAVLLKLKQLNINGNLYGWIKDYLSNRSIQVKADGTLSDIVNIENGTPQGSSISPTLFNLAINDISLCLKHCQMSQFADDGALWYS